MPPLALMSAAACSAPFLSWAPKAALGPVSGPATPTLICADAPPAQATLVTMASAGQNTFFIRGLPILTAAPTQRTLASASRRMIQRKHGKVTIYCGAPDALHPAAKAQESGSSARH